MCDKKISSRVRLISLQKYCCIGVKYYNILEYDQTSPLNRPTPTFVTQKTFPLTI
jgi:hypothetical protein